MNKINDLEIGEINKCNRVLIFDSNVDNHPILYFGICHDKQNKIEKIYIGESSNFSKRYFLNLEKKDEGSKNKDEKSEQLVSLIKYALDKKYIFKGYTLSIKSLFNASATKQLETIFIKLLIAKFGSNIITNKKIHQNIHFYNNKIEIDEKQEQIFNETYKSIFNNLKICESSSYNKLVNLERSKLNPIIMDDIQTDLVEHIVNQEHTQSNCLIKGSAGTGKTLTIVAVWEEIVRKRLKKYFENNEPYKKVLITSAKKNQIAILKKYIKETIKTFEYDYSTSQYKIVKKLVNVNDVIDLYKRDSLKLVNENTLIIDEAHGIIHSLDKQMNNVYFLHYPLNKQDNYQYPNNKYKDDKNIYHYIKKAKLIFVYDENQITKIDNINLNTLIEMFNISQDYTYELTIPYRNIIGFELLKLFKGEIKKCNFDNSKIVFVNSLQELKTLHENKSQINAKYNRLLSNVSFDWKNEEIIETNIKKTKIFNRNSEEKWFENDWINKKYINEKWYEKTEKKSSIKKYQKDIKQNVIYPTFGYANSIIGRDLENSFTILGKDIILFDNKIIPNLEGIQIKWKNGPKEDFDASRWNEYKSQVKEIEVIEKTSHESLTYFKDPAIPTWNSSTNKEENYFLSMQNYVLNNYFILLSRAVNINYIFVENEEIELWLKNAINK